MADTITFHSYQLTRGVHVHCSVDPVWIITAYDPTLDPEEWNPEFKKRRKKV